MNTTDTVTIQQQFISLLNETRTSTVNERLSLLLDNISKEFEKKTIVRTDLNIIDELATTLSEVHRDQWLFQPQLLGHPIFVIVRDCLVNILFSEKQVELETKLSTLLHNVCFATSVKDEMVHLMLYEPLMDKMNIFISQFEQYRGPVEPIQTMSRLLHIFRRIQMMRIDLHQDSLLETLFLNVSKCISSPFLMAQLPSISNTMAELEPKQLFLFDTCIEFLYWQPYEESLLRRQTLGQICDALLPTIVRLMSSLSFSEPILRIASLLTIHIMASNNDTDGKVLHQDYFALMKHCVAMLNDGSVPLKERTLLECICHLANHPDLLAFMKEFDSLKPTLLKLSEVEDCEISLNAYRILAFIMCESDIKTLQNAERIVGVFYLYFISMMDDPVQRTAFQVLLQSLKSLMQHDQVKVEVLQQDMIPLLIRSVVEKHDFHSIKSQQYAIEILLALSFNDKALSILQKDHDLSKCLAILKNSNEEAIQRATNLLIWELERKRTIPHPSVSHTTSKWKFDIMISYSHNDKVLCFQICDFLEKDGLHVWLDRDRMHGDAIVAMADAIENSEFVIICMSESYKSSPYCQAEANYAFQRRCKLLPLVMKPKYKPDGWLGFITSGKIYVDFTKYELNQAYSLLKNEIEKKREIPANKPKESEVIHEPVMSISSSTKLNKQQAPIDLPHSVNDWSEEHVRYFLNANNFTSLCTVFDNFNGHLLYQSYLMCEKNRESMFQAMRQEASATSNSSTLTLGTYLRFLEELKKYVPVDTNNASQRKTTAACSIV